jgi:uncharacterized protein (TIGR02145 family)
MRITGLLIWLLFSASIFAQSIVTPVFVLKDGDASVAGYTGSDKGIVIDGSSQQSVGWITFQTQGIDFSKIASVKLTLYIKSITAPGTLQVRLLTADIKAPENTVRLTSIPAAVAVTANQALGTADVENALQIDLTSAVKAGSFFGVALTSDDGLRAVLDSKEGRLAPMVLLTYNVDDVASKWLSGAGVPSASAGKDGDYYLNSSNGDVSAKSGGVWSVVANVVGPQGSKGNKGDKGDQGIQGIQGLKGDQGDPGTPGVNGTNGTNGSQGLPGADGKSIVWRKAWSADSNYSVNDAISYSGNSYIAIKVSSNKVPADSVSYWSLIANKGDNGDPGVAFDDAQVLTTKTWSSSKINSELANKVVVVTGKGLSTKDYTAADSNKLAAISGTNTGDQDLSGLATKTEVATSLAGKVDKVTGKGLSTKDYTVADSNKLAAFALGTTKGDMQYWNGTRWLRIAAGGADQVLSRVGTDSIPVWRSRPLGSVMDIDCNIYQTVVIGNQEWTVTNLRTTRYSDGALIYNETNNSAWTGLTSGAYCYYNNSTDAGAQQKYGALYNWYAVNTGKLAPAGWRVPTDADWTALENYLIANGFNYDGTLIGSKIAKSMAAGVWDSTTGTGFIGDNMSLNNKSGFSAVGGGWRNGGTGINGPGSFDYQRVAGNWWSATENTAQAFARSLSKDNISLIRSLYSKKYGLSVKLVRDLN